MPLDPDSVTEEQIADVLARYPDDLDRPNWPEDLLRLTVADVLAQEAARGVRSDA